MCRLAAGEAVHRAGEVWERLEVAAPFEVPSIDDGREAHYFGPFVRAVSGNKTVHALDDVFELATATVYAGHAVRVQEPAAQQVMTELGWGYRGHRFGGGHISHPCVRGAWRRWPGGRDRC